MKKSRFAAAAPLVSLALLVSACGGGGVASTPSPTPSPAPSPTPSPAPGSGGNNDLLAPLVSESFVNNAVHATASYPTDGGSATLSTSSGPLTFSYNASDKTYTVSTLGRSQSFAPANLDAALSNSQAATYIKTSGNRTDSLVLSKPGTSGPLTYRYVGAGFWQRTDATSASISGSFDAFVYGVPTPNAAMVRSGAARYAVALQGAYATTDNLTSLRGDGDLRVDFETGEMSTRGIYRSYLANGLEYTGGDWEGSARVISGTNDFNGSMNFYPVGTSSWSGQFFGPNADEVGAVISGSSIFGTVAATLTGRYVESSNSQSVSLLNISRDTQLRTLGAIMEYERDSKSDAPHKWTLSRRGGLNSIPYMEYTASSQEYQIYGLTLGDNYPLFRPSDINSAKSNSRFVTYEIAKGNDLTTLQLYRQGSANSEIQLTYTGLAHYSLFQNPGPTEKFATEELWVVYYITGNQHQMPTSGSAQYSGVMYGVALPQGYGGIVGDVTGTLSLQANFGTGSFSGSLVPLITLRGGNGTVSPGTYPFTGMDSVITGSGAQSSWFKGIFLGPNAEEVAGSFQLQNSDYIMLGAAVGKRN